MSQPLQAPVNVSNQSIQGIVIVVNGIYYLLSVQQIVHNPSLSYADFTTYTVGLRVIANAQIGEWSSAIAASDIDAISTLAILLLPRLVTLSITAAIQPHSFAQNQHIYEGRILAILLTCTTLVQVKFPLEFRVQNGSMLLALRALPDLSILELRLPTTFTPTEQDIDRLQSQLAHYLLGFHQIQFLILPIQLVNTDVLQTLASLESLEVLKIIPVPARDDDKDTFDLVLRRSGIEQSDINFRALNTVDIGLDRVPQSRKFSTVAIIKNRLPRVLVI